MYVLEGMFRDCMNTYERLLPIRKRAGAGRQAGRRVQGWGAARWGEVAVGAWAEALG